MEVRRCQVWRIWGMWNCCPAKGELMTSRVLRLVWGLALSCCNKNLDISKAGQTLCILAFNFFNVLMQTSELIVSPLDMKSTSITPALSQNTVAITFPANCWDLTFFERNEVGWRHSIDALFDSGSKWWTQV